ncbi:MAG: HAD family hydrolase, partial [Hyphomicrobiales bacterium]
MDGTLLLSAAVFERIWRQWGEENGMDGEAIIAVAHGRRMIDTVREVCPPGLDPDAVAAELSRQEREDVEGIVAIAGVEPFLASIPADRWAIVTSADLDLCRIRLKAAGITPPDVLITAEDVTKGKPDPQGYLEAARRLGVAPADAIVFEDAPAGIAAGKAAGAE